VVINDAPGLSRETAKEEHMSKRLRVVLATDEDLLRDFGEAKLLIGLPVRPSNEAPAVETRESQTENTMTDTIRSAPQRERA
jgi:hypothetical protein